MWTTNLFIYLSIYLFIYLSIHLPMLHQFIWALLVACCFLAMMWVHEPRHGMMWQDVGTHHGQGRRRVRRAEGSPAVATFLIEMETRLKRFLRDARAAHPEDIRLRRIVTKWDGTLSETAPSDGNDIAYSLNKRSIRVCVRHAIDSKALVDANTCMFVLLHELAHLASVSLNHTPEFWENFRWILLLADNLHHYRYVHHESSPASMCGQKIQTSPLTCVKEGAPCG
jgi:hypothetical protein